MKGSKAHVLKEWGALGKVGLWRVVIKERENEMPTMILERGMLDAMGERCWYVQTSEKERAAAFDALLEEVLKQETESINQTDSDSANESE